MNGPCNSNRLTALDVTVLTNRIGFASWRKLNYPIFFRMLRLLFLGLLEIYKYRGVINSWKVQKFVIKEGMHEKIFCLRQYGQKDIGFFFDMKEKKSKSNRKRALIRHTETLNANHANRNRQLKQITLTWHYAFYFIVTDVQHYHHHTIRGKWDASLHPLQQNVACCHRWQRWQSNGEFQFYQCCWDIPVYTRL